MLNYKMDYNKYDVPILKSNDRLSSTCYIDYFTWDEVTHSVMKGIDKYSRPFIVVKMVVIKKQEGSDKLELINIMQTFFQRYTGAGSHWMGCGHATPNLVDTCGGMTPIQVKFIDKLITNGKIKINDDHYCCNLKLAAGSTVYRLDYFD